MALECVLHGTLSLGDCTIVFGRVVHAAVDEDVLVDGHPDIKRLRPLARLGKNEWSTIGEIKTISRIPRDDWPGHYEGSSAN